jgi:8-oxo-dGTP pyrophosphatase MutT (NUDIX family)
MKERNKAVPAVYLLLTQEGMILMALRHNTGYQDGNWNVPSGHVEAGESPKAAMIREAKEEIGIDLAPDDLEFVHVSHRPKHDPTGDRIDFFFRARQWAGELKNAEPEKCAQLRWVSPAHLPENVTPHVRYIIEAVERDKMYSELDEQWIRSTGTWLLD